VLALAAVLVSLAAAAAGPPSTPGTLVRIAVKDPLTLRASGFGDQESVRVTVKSRTATAAQTVRSDRDGAFTVAFAAFRLDRSTDLDVSAVGARGHRFSFSLRHTTGGGGTVSTT
jgi:hypothetical protein